MAQLVSLSASNTDSKIVVRFGVQILLETRKVFRLDNSILNTIEIHLKQ